ncbi:MAG: secretin and TonB N-terminal domain-containing protein [Phycisphaerae bacterium]|nr:secretin and TonB N-terminal domain-containing protein [Phycisphaerae bacterium]
MLCAGVAFGQDSAEKGDDLFSDDRNDAVLDEVEKAIREAEERQGLKGAKSEPGESKPTTQPRTFTTETKEGGKLIGENDIRMTAGGRFSIHVQDIDLRSVLQHLSTKAKTNIIVSRNVSGTVTADLYSVTMQEALDAILTTNGLVYKQKGNFIYVYTAEEYELMREMPVRIFRLGYLRAKDAKTLVTPALSTTGIIAVTPEPAIGITPSSELTGSGEYASHDALVVRDYEENLEKIAEMLKELDILPQQVLIEATILSAKLTEGEALGIDLNTLCGVNFNSLGAISGMTTINTPYPNVGLPLPNVHPGAISNFSNSAIGTTQTFGSNVPAGAATFGLVTNHVAMFIRALETVTDVTVLATPKLTITNKQRGEVLIGKRDGYLTTTVTETSATQTVEFLETGTKLLVRPIIGRDDYIRLEIHPEDSSGTVAQVGGADSPALPSSTTTEVTTNVYVRDGRTMVIGGLFRDHIKLDRQQIPGVGDLPGIGAAFRSTDDTTIREEVIILITPHIIDHGPDEAVSERIKDDAERCRVGARLGLRWWSRSRLAGDYMRSARQESTNGNLSWALWKVDMALNIDPQMVEAIQLKEKLTQQAYWADMPMESSTRYVVTRMMMQEIGLPYEPIVTPRRPVDSGTLPKKVRNKFGIMKKPTDWPKPKPRKMTKKRSQIQTRKTVKPHGVVDLEQLDRSENPSLKKSAEPKADKNESMTKADPKSGAPEPVAAENTTKEVSAVSEDGLLPLAPIE